MCQEPHIMRTQTPTHIPHPSSFIFLYFPTIFLRHTQTHTLTHDVVCFLDWDSMLVSFFLQCWWCACVHTKICTLLRMRNGGGHDRPPWRRAKNGGTTGHNETRSRIPMEEGEDQHGPDWMLSLFCHSRRVSPLYVRSCVCTYIFLYVCVFQCSCVVVT